MGTGAANWVARAPRLLHSQEAGKRAAPGGGGGAQPDRKGSGRLGLPQTSPRSLHVNSVVSSLRVNDEDFQGHFKLSGFLFVFRYIKDVQRQRHQQNSSTLLGTPAFRAVHSLTPILLPRTSAQSEPGSPVGLMGQCRARGGPGRLAC